MSGNGNDVYNLADGWLELDSDPGLFTLLLQDFGVQGVQVEEIYDLQSEGPLVQEGALGFIFLFKWIEERRARLRKMIDEEALYVKEPTKDLFFAHQIVPNSCATHALISILLNLEKQLPNATNFALGSTLESFKSHVEGMDAETKGLAIGNSPQLAQAHNAHAVPRARRRQDRSSQGTPSLPASFGRGGSATETFHFVSYVPVKGRLYELDGLKRYPIDHGPIPSDGTDWTETFRRIIKERLGMSPEAGGGRSNSEPYHDIRFALMAVVPDRRSLVLDRLLMLRSNRNIVVQALKELLESSNKTPSSHGNNGESNGKAGEEDLARLEKDVQRVLLKRKRAESRASSVDSGGSGGKPPGSPFQSNPLLVNHDYSKSPAMEAIDEDEDVEIERELMMETNQIGASDQKSTSPTEKQEQIESNLPAKTEESNGSKPGLDFDPKLAKLYEPQRFSPADLLQLLRSIESDIAECDSALKDENEKHKRHTVDDCRRVHDYDEFITTFLAMLAEQGHLGDLLEQALNLKKNSSGGAEASSSATSQTSNGKDTNSDEAKPSKTSSSSKNSSSKHSSSKHSTSASKNVKKVNGQKDSKDKKKSKQKTKSAKSNILAKMKKLK